MGTASKRRILLVDDENLIGRAISRLLRGDCDVVSVTSARLALAHLALDAQFDVILCDLAMPEVSGEAFFAEISLRSPSLARSVVFVTGSPAQYQRFIETTSNRMLAKPFSEAELRDALGLPDAASWLGVPRPRPA